MSEKKLYQDFKKSWKFYIERIEPKNEIGIPDVHLVNNSKVDIFMELKYLPKKFQAVVLPIKKTQFIWHSKYPGKHAYMLFQIADRYYLFRKGDVFNLRGKVTWQSFYNLSITDSTEIFRISSYLENLSNKVY
jgi:hypothetical protein